MERIVVCFLVRVVIAGTMAEAVEVKGMHRCNRDNIPQFVEA
jgi:hypothetical protein